MSFQPSLKTCCSPHNPPWGRIQTNSLVCYVDFAIPSLKGCARSLQLLSWCQLVSAEKVRRWNTGASPLGKETWRIKEQHRKWLEVFPELHSTCLNSGVCVLCHRSPVSKGITLCNLSGKQSLQSYHCEDHIDHISTSLSNSELADLQGLFLISLSWANHVFGHDYWQRGDRRIQWCCSLIAYPSFKVWNCNSGKSHSTKMLR